MPTYRVKNWDRFQHYKDRTPPWIRLHRGLLDDYEFHCLPDASRALAPCLWLLASENPDPSRGEIAAADEKIAFRLRMPVRKFQDAVKPLIEHGFFEMERDASEVLADGPHGATPEAETEAEGEVHTPRGRKTRIGLEDLSVDHIADWLARKRAEGKYLRHDEHFVLEQFKDYCTSKGKTYVDYIAAYRGAFEWDRCRPRPQHQHQLRPGNAALGQAARPGSKADRTRAAIEQALLDLGHQP